MSGTMDAARQRDGRGGVFDGRGYDGTSPRQDGLAADVLAWEAGHEHDALMRNPSAASTPGGATVGAFIGTIASYDDATGTALVTPTGSPDRLVGPLAVTAGLPRDAEIVGAACLVVELDPYNPADGVAAAVWGTSGGAGGPTLGAALTQAGRATAAIPAGATGTTVAVVFARPYAVPPVVVASANDARWTAAVTATTPSGCTLSVTGAASSGDTIEVCWIAVG